MSDKNCHCGQPIHYGYNGNPTDHRGMCAHCDDLRCDTDPRACKPNMTIEITDEMRKVAGDAVHDHLYDKPAPDYASPTGDDFQDIGLAALAAALPIIEKQVRAALEAPIRELHWGDASVGIHAHICAECGLASPCPTIRALDGDK